MNRNEGITLTGELAERVSDQLLKIDAAYSGVDKDFIRVYSFREAPNDLRALSPHGGDEDWLAVVPPDYSKRHYISWLQPGSPFGVCNVSEHELIDGTFVYIGAHA
jgi:hypothetical protein